MHGLVPTQVFFFVGLLCCCCVSLKAIYCSGEKRKCVFTSEVEWPLNRHVLLRETHKCQNDQMQIQILTQCSSSSSLSIWIVIVSNKEILCILNIIVSKSFRLVCLDVSHILPRYPCSWLKNMKLLRIQTVEVMFPPCTAVVHTVSRRKSKHVLHLAKRNPHGKGLFFFYTYQDHILRPITLWAVSDQRVTQIALADFVLPPNACSAALLLLHWICAGCCAIVACLWVECVPPRSKAVRLHKWTTEEEAFLIIYFKYGHKIRSDSKSMFPLMVSFHFTTCL